MGLWKEWSSWLREGYFISYVRNGIRYYEYILFRDLAHYVYEWHETVQPGATSGPFVPANIVMTLGYDSDTFMNRIWQTIFGIKGQAYIYLELPTDTHRHGLPKIPKPSSVIREVSHFEEWMSDFHEPSFVTEHIMMKPGYDRINFEAYNPHDIAIKPYLNVFIAKLTTERVGTERYGVLRTPVAPDDAELTELMRIKWAETLEKLYKGQIPQRLLTLSPVRAPAAE